VKVADRAGIPPFFVMEVMRAAEERELAGREVLHLEVGQPATRAPSGAIAAAHRALDDNTLGYTTALGLPELRSRIAQHYGQWYAATVTPDGVAVTIGASAACVLAFLAAFDVGDRVAVVSPGYPCYRNMLEAFGVEVVEIEVGPSTRFQPSPALLAGAGRLDGLVLASPSNPTGTMIDRAAMEELLAYCGASDIRLVSDEIYHGIAYDQPAVTAWRPGGSALVVNSFSKYFSMTGWRLGWLLMPHDLAPAVERLAQNLFISAPTISQLAGLAAFDCQTELDGNVERYRANRDILLDGLTGAGFALLAPADGGFYIYADVSHLSDDSKELCATWLDELGLAVTPGIDFDRRRGHQWVRFSFAGAADDIGLAVDRLSRWVAGHPTGSQG
jgi:aspartate/methionine/tyrosine aminotransferase